ncbi:MAG: primosomal protein N' [Clostridiales bacterium]|nr:MAG: primosomal protein N' [Clostridiales bacterium]
MPEKTVLVAVENVPYPADILYEYKVGGTNAQPGHIVTFPFGKGNKKARGIVFAYGKNTEGKRLKTLTSLYSDEIYIDHEGILLAEFMKNKYFCSYFEAVRTIMPSGIMSSKTASEKSGIKVCYEEYAHISHTAEEYKKSLGQSELAKKHLAIIEFLKNGEQTVRKTLEYVGITKGVLLTLQKKGVLTLEKREALRSPLRGITPQKAMPTALNQEQQTAFEQIRKKYDTGGAHLLYGVTGSGKTHVFIALINDLIKQNKSVLLLLPEISLTLQIVRRFYAEYGEKLAVLHSALSQGERFDEWRRIRDGRATVVIGTRSAVFAPLKNLGAIIIDEEQEHTYKSDMSPKYAAAEIAAFRVKREKAFLLTASATPSFESWYKAQKDEIGFSQLTTRYNGRPLPKVIVADMRPELASGNKGLLGKILGEEILKNMQNGEQSVLFMNRRGYNAYVSCPSCGYVYTCPSCGISLTYHKTDKKLRCHYCGHSENLSSTCKKCGSTALFYSGAGTQRAEEEIKNIFPELRILRMDADTVVKKGSRDKILSDFRQNKYDVLLGTQMITKGLDFPNVTLVGVLNADASLYTSDFRSYEKTFSLITQVVGRAGRAEKEGRAVIQTYSPEHQVLEFAFKQDYPAFFNSECALRKALIYPPYCDVCQVIFLADGLVKATEGAEKFIEMIKNLSAEEFADVPLRIIQPLQTAVPMTDGKDRVRILLKCKDVRRTRDLFARVTATFMKENKDIYISIDMNPSAIL